MPDLPFHVAGGVFAAKPSSHPRFEAAFLSQPKVELSKTDLPEAANSSRRRRLWEISHKFHCPVVGTCFDVKELRSLMHKVMHLPSDTSDFVLHTTAVGACETRTRLAELLHKTLEKRYALIIKRFANAKTADGVRQYWQEAIASGVDIAGALWAAWTHPACDSLLEQEIYGDIHMLQHQIGSGTRADLKALRLLREQNGDLQRQLAAVRAELDAARLERATETRSLAERLTESRAEQAGRDACIARLSSELDRLRESLPDLRQRQVLARRADDAEARAVALAAQCRKQDEEIEHLRLRLRDLESSVSQAELATATGNEVDKPAAFGETLDGKCILCVGGRAGAVDAYRDAVLRHGGRFLHHDGGLEESLHRIDGVLAAADIVICQTGCISHNAYWRVKEQCKRTGKPCVFIKGSGSSAFDRLIRDFDQNARLAASSKEKQS